MPNDSNATELWAAYQRSDPQQPSGPMPSVHRFGDHASMQDELLQLVIDGTKRATAALVVEYEREGDPIPAPGDHWIVADGAGVARLVLQSTEIRVGVLESVDAGFAADEGEGERTRASWLADHRRFWGRTEPAGTDLESVAVVFERFRVVWPPEHRDRE